MPRPPNQNSASRFGGYQASSQTRRFFTLPIPSVDSDTLDAVQNFIREKQPGLIHRAAWDQARYRSDRIQEEVKELEGTLRELIEEKEQAIRDVADTREEQLERSLLKMERKMRMEHEKLQKEKDDDFKREIKEIIEKRESLVDHENQRSTKEQEEDKSHEPTSKRPRLDPGAGSKAHDKESAKNDVTQSQDEASSDLEEGELTEGETEEPNETGKHKPNEDDDGDQSTKTETKGESTDSQGKPESEVKSEELKNVRTQLESLKETKSQMVWLLRQVITAEKKRKDQAKNTNKN